MPGSIANAQLAGLSPQVGLYASTLPLVAYALFGTSRQLMVGPSAGTAALVAAAIAPLAGGDATLYLSMSMVLALVVGVCASVRVSCGSARSPTFSPSPS